MTKPSRAIVMLALGITASVTIHTRAAAQSLQRLSGSAAVGLGANSDNDRYDSSFLVSSRLGLGIGLTSRLGLEAGLHKTWDLLSGSDNAVAVPPGGHLPVSFWHVGGTASLVFTPGRMRLDSPIRLLGGAGVYRVSATQITGQETPTITKGGIHLGIETALKRGKRSTLFAGLRSVYFPDLGGEAAWHFPFEIGIRIH